MSKNGVSWCMSVEIAMSKNPHICGIKELAFEAKVVVIS